LALFWLNLNPYKRVDRDNKNRVLIKPEWLQRTEEVIVEEEDLKERINKVQKKDEKVVKAVEELKRAGIKTLRNKEWSIEDGLLLKEERIYIPEGGLRVEIIRLHHDTAVGGHRGRWKMVELVGRSYWWPGMTKEVGRYIEECNACQRYKNNTEALAEKLMPNTKYHTKEIMDTHKHRLYYQTATCPRIQLNLSCMQLSDQDSIFNSNNRENFGGGTCQAVQGPDIEGTWTTRWHFVR